MEPRHLIRAAIAVSVIGHAALAVGVYFADARPLDPSIEDSMAVALVTPEEVAAIIKPPEETPPEPPKPPDPFRLPDLSKPTTETKPQAAAPKASPQTAVPPAQPQAAPAQPPQQPPSPQQAASQPPSAQPMQPPPPQQQQAALQPPPSQPQPAEAPSAPQPDITVKYGVMLGLPEMGGGSTVSEKADLAPLDIAAFRRHLKSCSKLPGAVTPNDKVRIVMRAFLAPNGRLMTEPSLIEASASAKGPLLMQAAMQALQACQPYAMLPPDKYNEWKVLDLAFTPQDFAG